MINIAFSKIAPEAYAFTFLNNDAGELEHRVAVEEYLKIVRECGFPSKLEGMQYEDCSVTDKMDMMLADYGVSNLTVEQLRIMHASKIFSITIRLGHTSRMIVCCPTVEDGVIGGRCYFFKEHAVVGGVETIQFKKDDPRTNHVIMVTDDAMTPELDFLLSLASFRHQRFIAANNSATLVNHLLPQYFDEINIIDPRVVDLIYTTETI